MPTAPVALARIAPATLAAAVELLKQVGLDADDDFGFARSVERIENYIAETTFEWTERGAGMRFLVERDRWTERVVGIHVFDLGRYSGGGHQFSDELIAEVNLKLQELFTTSEVEAEEAIAKLEPVDVLRVAYDSQVATVRRANGDQFGINLWELAGRSRRCDGFISWRFRDSGNV